MPPRGAFDFVLEIQFESKLYLSWIEGGIAGRPDFPKTGAIKITRIRDCGHTVTAKVRSIEVRMVNDVEKFCPELQRSPLGYLKGLERGEIPSMESGTDCSSLVPAQNIKACCRNTTRRRVWNRASCSEDAGLLEGSRITEPTQLSI